MKSNTVFLARYIGAFTIIETILLILYHTQAQQRIYDVLYDRALGFTYGLITLAIGLAIVTTHNAWRGGRFVVVGDPAVGIGDVNGGGKGVQHPAVGAVAAPQRGIGAAIAPRAFQRPGVCLQPIG